MPWAEWLASLEAPGPAGVLDRSVQFLTPVLSGDRAGFEAVALECPLGALMVDAVQMLVCYEHGGPDAANSCYAGCEERVRAGIVHYGLRVLIGTRWPILDTARLLGLSAWAEAAARLAADAGLGCGSLQAPILDWPAFRAIFSRADWYQPAVDVAYGPELEQGWRGAADECPLGFLVANLVKAMLCAHTESICFGAHDGMARQLLSPLPLHLVEGSGWPVVWLMTHIPRVVRRHRFHLDFAPHELLSSAEGLPAAAGEETAEASRAMAHVRRALPALRRAAAAIAPGADTPPLSLVYATMAHGPRFVPYVGRFISRARAIGIGDVLVVFCLDDGAFVACQDVGGHCIPGTPSILNKFTLPLVLLRDGLDVMWIDLDVFLFQSPTPFVAEQLRAGYDLLISGAFAVDCVCSGVVLYRAVARTRAWLERLLVWMYEHPYEHDQKAVSAFLRAGERVAFEEELPVPTDEVPTWAFLDPETRFVSARHVDVAGWTGDPDDIVAFHFLHGDSDDAEASRQFAARNSLGVGYTPLMDLFFNQSELPELYNTAALPHHVSAELKRALWLSRWSSRRPASPGRCNETVPMNF